MRPEYRRENVMRRDKNIEEVMTCHDENKFILYKLIKEKNVKSCNIIDLLITQGMDRASWFARSMCRMDTAL